MRKIIIDCKNRTKVVKRIRRFNDRKDEIVFSNQNKNGTIVIIKVAKGIKMHGSKEDNTLKMPGLEVKFPPKNGTPSQPTPQELSEKNGRPTPSPDGTS